ncbi:MAG TPA: lamin tail domain-containing protein [Candidatus Thermoplasmatota archaeon]|nr:lamin tail domain-containing protein [Candidatus Thermoplasmatota archaeon]
MRGTPWLRPSLRGSRKGSAGAAPGLLAVGFALLVVAAEIPGLGPADPGLLRQAALAEVEAALDEEAVRIAHLVARAWSEVDLKEREPEIRAQVAAQAAYLAALDRAASTPGEVRVRLTGVRVAVEELPFSALPGELCVRLSGSLESFLGPWESHREVSERACDPEAPRARGYLNALLVDQVEDPRSQARGAVRVALTDALRRPSRLSPTDLQGTLDRALFGAGVAIGDTIFGGPPAGPGNPPRAPEAPAPPAPEPALGWMDDIEPSDFQAYVRGFAEPFAALPFARLLAEAAGGSALLLRAAASLTEGDEGPLLSWLEELTGQTDVARALLADASALLSAAVREIRGSLQKASAEHSEALERLLGTPPPSAMAGRTEGPVRLRARNGTLEAVSLGGPRLLAGGAALPYVTHALVRFDLEAEVAIEVAGRPLLVRHNDTVVVRVIVASPGRVLEGPLARAATSTGASPTGLDPLAPFSKAIEFLEQARREVDRRLLAFREAVSERLAQASASSLARVALRALEAAADGDLQKAALALFAFIERFAADPLREALTANITVLGVPFRFVGDPVGQQASLEYSQGPHTFGARLRRVTQEGNPFAGALGDPLSLALEVYWRYERPPVTASLVLDPLMRSRDGVVRFDVRVDAGEGLALSTVAPRLIRRGAVLELALSDLLPGGIPVAVTPSGALVRLDAGLRVEVARATPLTLVRFALGAFGRALIDVLENQTAGELGEQLSVEALARRFFERLLQRAADTFAGDASRFVLKASAFVSVEGGFLGVPAGAGFEAALAVHGPIATWREAASGAGALARAAASGAFARRFEGTGLIDLVPDRVHSNVGLELRFAIEAGLGALPFVGPVLDPYPSARLAQNLFLSAGALASLAGGRGVHWVTEYGVGLEGLKGLRLPLPWGAPGPFDILEAVHLRAESLAGPRVLISEALPAPRGEDTDLEFVELYNPNPAEVLLTGWSIRDSGGRRFTLPSGTRIAPSGVLLVARSAFPFFARFGVVPDVSTLTLALNDEGDRLTLMNERGWASDSVAWGPFSPVGRMPQADSSLARPRAQAPPAGLQASELRFTGSPLDFLESPPTPGRKP